MQWFRLKNNARQHVNNARLAVYTGPGEATPGNHGSYKRLTYAAGMRALGFTDPDSKLPCRKAMETDADLIIKQCEQGIETQ